jgi:large subunit ribosomal protein L35
MAGVSDFRICKTGSKDSYYDIFMFFREGKMPKIRSHSGAKKRFFITGKGKIKRKKSFARHILTDKPSKKIRQLRKSAGLNTVDTKRIKTVLPYL